MTVHDLRRPANRPAELLRRAGDLSSDPPPEVWDGVVAALEVDAPNPAPGAEAPTRRRPGGRVRAGTRSRHRRGAGPAGQDVPSKGPGARLFGLGGPTGAGPLLAAAAAGAVLASAGHWVLDAGTGESSGQVLAAAGLGPVVEVSEADGPPTSARAEVVEVDGRRVLRVDLDGLVPVPEAGSGSDDPATGASAAYLEVWLLRPDVSGMVTLGVLEGGRAELVLPEGVSIEEYPLVDVSVEAVDGDPAHGGQSVLRGQLTVGQGFTALGS
ncbi:anti-sigma factor [Ornithinimicrobium sp. W1665]|uniref:anti-sigma factor n=1 Tax=Ornithinimicrobium sp. W1665 TaxID=3416666 RepID=UPI003CF4A587